MEDITFRMANGKFNLRVAGVFIKDSRVLVMSDNDLPYFYLPGGRVKLHETSEAAIRREISEELSEVHLLNETSTLQNRTKEFLKNARLHLLQNTY